MKEEYILKKSKSFLILPPHPLHIPQKRNNVQSILLPLPHHLHHFQKTMNKQDQEMYHLLHMYPKEEQVTVNPSSSSSAPAPPGASWPSSSSSGDSGSPAFLPGLSPNHFGSLATKKGIILKFFDFYHYI